MTQQSDVYNLTFPTGSNGIILDPDNQTTSDDGIPYASGSDLTQRIDIANISLTWQIKTSVYRGLSTGEFDITATRGSATEGLNFTFESGSLLIKLETESFRVSLLFFDLTESILIIEIFLALIFILIKNKKKRDLKINLFIEVFIKKKVN